MSDHRPDYTKDIDEAERLATDAKRGDDGDWEADEVLATASVSVALSLVTLTRQIADFGPSLASELLDRVTSSVQSIDTQIGGTR